MKNANLNSSTTELRNTNPKVISFVIACISEFAKQLEISVVHASNYLIKFKGLEFLIFHYSAQHLLSIDDSVQDLILICKKNGGTLQ